MKTKNSKMTINKNGHKKFIIIENQDKLQLSFDIFTLFEEPATIRKETNCISFWRIILEYMMTYFLDEVNQCIELYFILTETEEYDNQKETWIICKIIRIIIRIIAKTKGENILEIIIKITSVLNLMLRFHGNNKIKFIGVILPHIDTLNKSCLVHHSIYKSTKTDVENFISLSV